MLNMECVSVASCRLAPTRTSADTMASHPTTQPPLSKRLCRWLLSLALLTSSLIPLAESCSSRSTPRGRPLGFSSSSASGPGPGPGPGQGIGSNSGPASPSSLSIPSAFSFSALSSPNSRPNVTFQTYACPEAYAKWYCLNGATCFSLRIGESILYNCECADGYMGQRCEFKDLDGSYLHKSGKEHRLLVERASVSTGSLVILLVASLLLLAAHISKDKLKMNDLKLRHSSNSTTTTPRRRALEDKRRADSCSSSPSLHLSLLFTSPDNRSTTSLARRELRLNQDIFSLNRSCNHDHDSHATSPATMTASSASEIIQER